MLKKYIKTAVLSLSVMAGMTVAVSCSDNDKDPNAPDDPKGEMEEMTPDESKDFLESSARTMINTLDASDQEDFIKTVSYACENYGDLQLPDNFDVESDESNPTNFLKSLKSAVSQGAAYAMGSSYYTYVYNIDYRKFKGVYEVRGYEWRKTENSDNIVFKFRGYDNSDCVLTVEPSKDYSDLDFKTEYDDYYYSETNEYYIKIPKTVKVTLVAGTRTLADGTVNTSISKNAHKVSANADITIANINAKCSIDGSDSKIEAAFVSTVNGKIFTKGNTTVNGSHLCDVEYFMDNEIESEDIYKYFSSGTANINAMDLVQVDASANLTRELCKLFDRWYDSEEYDNQADAETAIAADVKVFNKCISADVRYNNTKTVQAKLKFDYTFYDNYYWWEYEIIPVFKFESDGSSYSFDEYFERGFGSVERQWSSLVRSYERLWNSALK